MKSLPFIITGVAVIVGVLTGDWMIRAHFAQQPKLSATAVPAPVHSTVQPPVPTHSPINEWQAYHLARAQVLRDNPEIAAEYQELRTETLQHEQDLDAAMIKVDPKVAPILAKLAAMRRAPIPANPAPQISNGGIGPK